MPNKFKKPNEKMIQDKITEMASGENVRTRNTAKNKKIESYLDAAIHYATLNNEAKNKVLLNLSKRVHGNPTSLPLQQLYRWAKLNYESGNDKHPPEKLFSY